MVKLVITVVCLMLVVIPVHADDLDWEIKFYHTDNITSKDLKTVKDDLEKSKQVITTPKRGGKYTLYKGKHIECSYSIQRRAKGMETLTLTCMGDQQLIINVSSCMSVKNMPELRNANILNISDLNENMTFRFEVKCNCVLH